MQISREKPPGRAWAGGWVRLTAKCGPQTQLSGSAGTCIDRTELTLRGDEPGREAGAGRALEAMTSQLCLDGYWVVLQSLGAVLRRLVCQATCQLDDITIDSALGWTPYKLRQAGGLWCWYEAPIVKSPGPDPRQNKPLIFFLQKQLILTACSPGSQNTQSKL